MELAELRNLIDETPDQVTPIRNDLSLLYAYADLDAGQSQRLSDVVKALMVEVSRCFSCGERSAWMECRMLTHQLIYEHVLDGKALEPCFSILSRIADAVRKPESETLIGPAYANWPRAVLMAKQAITLSPWHQTDELIRRTHGRQFAVGEAAVVLRTLGYHPALRKGAIYLSKEELRDVCERIARAVAIVGGEVFASYVFNPANFSHCAPQHRFHFVRRINPLGQGVSPIIPIYYLMQLALKTPFDTKYSGFEKAAAFSEAVKISTALAAHLDVQPYNAFELMFKGVDTMLSFLQELALYDSLFVPAQLRPADCLTIMDGLASGLSSELELSEGVSLGSALHVAKVLLGAASQRIGPIMITPAAVAKAASIRPREAQSVLDFYSHSERSNMDFVLPIDAPDSAFRPLFANGRADYLLIDPSFCSAGFAETLMAALRLIVPEYDAGVGYVVEQILRDQLTEHGVSFVGGTYKIGKVDGECDIVIETSNRIIFMETKKKPLTRKSRAGSDAHILIDLAESLVAATIQTGQHEIMLRKHGVLDLRQKDNSVRQVRLGGRDIERVSLTFLDYGAFHDRTVLEQFLLTGLRVRFGAVDAANAKRIGTLNKKLDVLSEQCQELSGLDARRKEHPFFHCWFLGVPHVLIMLDQVGSNDDFATVLFRTRHVSTGTLDWYHDFEYLGGLKKAGGAPNSEKGAT